MSSYKDRYIYNLRLATEDVETLKTLTYVFGEKTCSSMARKIARFAIDQTEAAEFLEEPEYRQPREYFWIDVGRDIGEDIESKANKIGMKPTTMLGVMLASTVQRIQQDVPGINSLMILRDYVHNSSNVEELRSTIPT